MKGEPENLRMLSREVVVFVEEIDCWMKIMVLPGLGKVKSAVLFVRSMIEDGLELLFIRKKMFEVVRSEVSWMLDWSDLNMIGSVPEISMIENGDWEPRLVS